MFQSQDWGFLCLVSQWEMQIHRNWWLAAVSEWAVLLSSLICLCCLLASTGSGWHIVVLTNSLYWQVHFVLEFSGFFACDRLQICDITQHWAMIQLNLRFERRANTPIFGLQYGRMILDLNRFENKPEMHYTPLETFIVALLRIKIFPLSHELS